MEIIALSCALLSTNERNKNGGEMRKNCVLASIHSKKKKIEKRKKKKMSKKNDCRALFPPTNERNKTGGKKRKMDVFLTGFIYSG